MRRCICLCSYIKPQRKWTFNVKCLVVYVSVPTSNHNAKNAVIAANNVVYVSVPTSNHNSKYTVPSDHLLYMSLFLHQTTTKGGIVVQR